MTSLITLVPAYKTEYLAELFLGLAGQSFRDFKVVLSDDSPGGAVTALLRSGSLESLLRNIDLVVVQGPRRGPFRNVRHLLDGFAGQAPLVHLMMDDDIVYPDFYRAHVQAHARHPIGASVSQRWLTAADGRPGASLPVPAFLDQIDERVVFLDAEAMFGTTAALGQNWLGEHSNAVLSAEAARRLRDTCIQGLSYQGLGDIGVLLDVSLHSPVAFIRDHLGGFRSHPNQNTNARASFGLKCGYLAWIALALGGRRAGRLTDAQTLSALATTIQRTVTEFASDPIFAELFAMTATLGTDLVAFDRWFDAWWRRLLEAEGALPVAASLPVLQPA